MTMMARPDREHPTGPTRRDVLRYGVAGAVALGASGLLAACHSGSGSQSPSTAAGPPKRGGTLTVGLISGGQTESLDPWTAFATNDYARVINLYDSLFEYDDNLAVHPALAESGEPNADNTEWTIRLRQGVTFHDGSPLTADDVIHNVQAWMDPNQQFYPQVGKQIDPQRITKLDDRTVRLGLQLPNARLNRDLAFLFGSIKSRNEQPGGPPIGTGPFKYSRFTPGAYSEFLAFTNHWRPDPVYLDRLVFDTSFTDENTRTNALNSGQIDLLPFISFGLAETISGRTAKLLNSKSSGFTNFYMRVDAPPFDDVRVRQAMRLLVDRQAMVDVVYAGYGTVSNDVPGQFAPFFDDNLTRHRDVDQAKFLLKQAGKEGLTVTLQTSNATDGLVQSATIFKEQAKAAGVTVNLEQVDPASYFDPTVNYGKMDFAQTLYYPIPSMEFVWNASFLSNGPVNETHWYNSPAFGRSQQLFVQAKATADPGKLGDLWHELQLQQFNEGGYLNYGVMNYVDAMRNEVQGLTPSKYLFASGFNLRKAWLSK
jgi:peptide/nickel transport system substrate-binding protein